jgi:hypothetical protein
MLKRLGCDRNFNEQAFTPGVRIEAGYSNRPYYRVCSIKETVGAVQQMLRDRSIFPITQ